MRKKMIYSKNDLADSNLAFTVKPIYDECVYLPENECILNKLEKIFRYEKLHVTLCCTFIDDKNILEELASDIVSFGEIIFDITSIDLKNKKNVDDDVRSCMIWLSNRNEHVDDITNHIRDSCLRGLQKSEYRRQLKFPSKNNHHLLLKIEDDAVECLQYIKQIEGRTVFLKELGHGKIKAFEYHVSY